MTNQIIVTAALTPEQAEIIKEIIQINADAGIRVSTSQAIRIALEAWKQAQPSTGSEEQSDNG